jgi:hypothetical protein
MSTDAHNDPVIQAARVAMCVNENPSLDETLQWFMANESACFGGARAKKEAE